MRNSLALLQSLLVIAALLLAAPVLAWSEVRVNSDNITVDVDAQGRATVTHEILLRTRGVPLKQWVVSGIDSDAVPLPEATFTLAKSGRAAGVAIGLITMADAGQLHLSVDGQKGIPPGSYLLKFSYQTELLRRGLIQAEAEYANLRWVGPRFDDGIDSVRVLFRFPTAARQAALPSADSLSAGVGLVEEYDGVFLSDFRRAQDKDELEVVRPHVAKGEPVVWRVRFDADALERPQLAEPSPEPQGTGEPIVAATAPSRTSFLSGQLGLFSVLFGLAFSYGLLLLKKTHFVRANAARLELTPRALLVQSPGLRAGLAGILLLLAGLTLVLSPWALLAAGCALGSMLLAIQLPPERKATRRGPGSWQALDTRQAFARPRVERSDGAILDGGRLPGAFLFVVATLLALHFGQRLFPLFAIRAVGVAVLPLLLVPIFFTGRAAELPLCPIERARASFKPLLVRLRREADLRVSVLVRIPALISSTLPSERLRAADEMRLVVLPERPLAGLTAIEIAYEFQNTLFSTVALPLLLVRVIEGSPAHEALPKGLVLGRGRKADERVCVLRPKVPSRRSTLKLVQQLCALLRPERAKTPKPIALSNEVQSSSARSSGGRAQAAAKGRTNSSPAHAT